MRSAIAAAVGTILAAVGVSAGTVALADDEPYLLDPPPVIEPPPVALPPAEVPLPPPPLVTIDDTSRDIPERFSLPPEEVEVIEGSDTRVSTTRETAANTGMGSDVEQWRSLVVAHFGVELADTALCLMGHESGGNPNAQNPSSGASGLMQVLKSWADDFGVSPDDLFDPATNLSISRSLYDDGGWGHWSPWNRGECH